MLYDVFHPQQLRVLVAIRDNGSLTGAAQSLGYGVPTIAHHLASLERHFKVQFVSGIAAVPGSPRWARCWSWRLTSSWCGWIRPSGW